MRLATSILAHKPYPGVVADCPSQEVSTSSNGWCPRLSLQVHLGIR
jgi:hypothetical protein